MRARSALIVGWLLLVYGLFVWNVLPPLCSEVLTKIQNIVKKHEKPPEQINRLSLAPPAGLKPPALEPAPPPPISPRTSLTAKEHLNALAVNLYSVFLAALIFLLAFGVGGEALGIAGLNSQDFHDPFALALGLGIFSYAALLLGAAGWFNRPSFYGLLAVAGVISHRSLLQELPRVKSGLLEFFTKKNFPYNFLISIFIGLYVLNSFLPDQFYDVLVYHLGLPQAYLVKGGLVAAPHNVHSAFPQTAEMLFTLGMGLVRGDHLPLLLQLGFSLLIIFTLIRFEPFAGKIAALLWASTPLVMENMRFAKSDALFSLWVLMSFTAIWDFCRDPSPGKVVLAGAFSGLAMGTKYTGIPFAAALSFLVFFLPENLAVRGRTKNLCLYWASSFLLFAPWLARNWILFHNPLYPFFQDWFGYVHMTRENWTVFRLEQSQYRNSVWQWQDLFISFWNNTFQGFKVPSMNFIGPVWLGCLPLLALFAFKRRLSLALSSIIFFALIFSSLQSTLARYFILPVLPLYALAIGLALKSWEGQIPTRLIGLMVGMGMALNFAGWLPLMERLSFGRKGLFGLPEARLALFYPEGYWESAKFVQASLPESAKILFLGETKSRLFERPVIAPSVHNQHLLSEIISASQSEPEVFERLKGEGITHILFNASEFARLKGYPTFDWSPKNKLILKEFWEKRLRLVYTSGPISIYELDSEHPGQLPWPSEIASVSS